ncbi:MAG: PAS domain-containing protein, partial [Pseudomonadota bacterium]
MDRIPLRVIVLRALPLMPLVLASLWLGASHDAWVAWLGLALSTALFVASLATRVRPIDRISRLEEVSRSLAVIEFTPEGQILHANDTFLDLMGYTLDEVVGQHHRVFVADDERNSEDYAAFWRALRTGQFQKAEFRRIAKDGTPRWITASYNPIFNSAGKLYKVIKFATDVTAQHSLIEDNQLVKFTLDSTSSCVLVANDQHEVTYLNGAMSRLLTALESDFRCVAPGFRVQGLVGQPVSSIHPTLSVSTLVRATSTVPVDVEESIGDTKVRIVVMPVINADGQRVGTIVKMADRTDEIATER